MNDLFVKFYQGTLVKGDFATLIAQIKGEVTGREEIMKDETDFFSWPVMFQCLAIDVIWSDTILMNFQK